MRTFTAMMVGTMIAVLGGCMHPQPRNASYIPHQYDYFLQTGTGVIQGQAFVVSADGNVKYCAGRQVALNPVTDYSTEWYQRTVLKGQLLKPADPAVPGPKIAIADAEGRFTFEGLQAGDYYVASYVDWLVTPYTSSGGWAHAQVRVEDGKTTKVVATQ